MRFWGHSYDVTVNTPSWRQLEQQVAGRLRGGDGFSIATINLDHLVKLRTNADFQHAYAAQDFVVADGNPIVWLSVLADRPVGLIPGSDSVLPLVRLAAENDKSIALVGSTDASLESAKRYIEDQVPGATVACTVSPPFGFDPNGDGALDVLEQVRASGAKMVFLALGAPKQELFAARGRHVLPDVGFVSVGAGLDFYSGLQIRAPQWVRTMAMEWMWRLLSDPTRMLPRYAKCFTILPAEIWHALVLRRASRHRLESTDNPG